MADNNQYVISYEDRDEIHTSRWNITGINTKSAGNTSAGWLFMVCSLSGTTVTVDLYKDFALGASDKVLTGTFSTASITTTPAKCSLTAANTSGLGGYVYFESYVSDPADDYVSVLATLCVDEEIREDWYDLAALPSYVYDSTNGLAKWCIIATKRVLLQVSHQYANELGGFGAKEQPYYQSSSRLVPDWRKIASPDQLKEATICQALCLALGSMHKQADVTMYSDLRDHYRQRYMDAVNAWHLAFNTDPSSDEDNDTMKSARSVRLDRI